MSTVLRTLAAAALAVIIAAGGFALSRATAPARTVTVTRTAAAPRVTVTRTATVTASPQPQPSLTPEPLPGGAHALIPPAPHVNGATHSTIVDCNVDQCTSAPGAGPYGSTCGPIVGMKQACVW